MNISYNWLGTYIDHGMDVRELSDVLTSCGLEVEGVQKHESVPGGLKGLVVGEVVEASRHPNADKLTLTKVDVGNGVVNQIVCGAPNVAQGQKVVVALPGTIIHPMNGEPFTIKKAKLRGEVSEGMICAEDEIGLGTDHDGIMVLDPALEPGTMVNSLYEVSSDHVLTIGLTPNRVDAASHIGVARDLSALMRVREKKMVPVKWPDSVTLPNQEQGPVVTVEVMSDEVIRYSGVHLNNVKVKESPEWLKQRLTTIGLKPINNVVDVTNFVLFEMGQPLHAFDASKISGKKVVVRNAEKGEKFVTLDDVERKLDGTELMICDAEKGMCIAGVFGGVGSGVTMDTTEVFLESACFDPVSIRKTSKRHDLKTDASFRYERGSDPDITITALKRAASLLMEIADAEVSSSVIDIYPVPVEQSRIGVSCDRINSLNGVELDPDSFEGLMEALEISFIKDADNSYELKVPPYRVDVKREADIAEEVLRLIGYDQIPVPDNVHMSLPSMDANVRETVRNSMSQYLVSCGYTEVMNNSLTGSLVTDLEVPELSRAAAIRNPLSKELDILRTNMLFPMLGTAGYNINRKRPDLRIFEQGFIYSFSNENYEETEKFSVLLTGDRYSENWMGKKGGYDPYYLKSVVSNMLSSAGVNVSDIEFEGAEGEFTDLTVGFMSGKTSVGKLGKVKPTVLSAFDIKGDVWYAEIDLSAVYNICGSGGRAIEEPPKYPMVKRDLSMILDKEITFDQMRKLAFDTERKFLIKVDLFDVYEGKNIGDGKKSYAVSFYLLDREQTMNDKVIDKVMSRIIAAYESKLGAAIRKS
jgi:phenylalanyl-tRNA synthetase beta chain